MRGGHAVVVVPQEQLLRRSYEPPSQWQPLLARAKRTPQVSDQVVVTPVVAVEQPVVEVVAPPAPVVEILEVALVVAPEVEETAVPEDVRAEQAQHSYWSARDVGELFGRSRFEDAVDVLLGAVGPDDEAPAAPPPVPLTRQEIRGLAGPLIAKPPVAVKESPTPVPAATTLGFDSLLRSKPKKKVKSKGGGGTKTVATATTTKVVATPAVPATDPVILLKARIAKIPAEIVPEVYAQTGLHCKAKTHASLFEKAENVRRDGVILIEPFVSECETLALEKAAANPKGRHRKV